MYKIIGMLALSLAAMAAPAVIKEVKRNRKRKAERAAANMSTGQLLEEAARRIYLDQQFQKEVNARHKIREALAKSVGRDDDHDVTMDFSHRPVC